LTHLKVSDIDSQRMVIHVQGGNPSTLPKRTPSFSGCRTLAAGEGAGLDAAISATTAQFIPQISFLGFC